MFNVVFQHEGRTQDLGVKIVSIDYSILSYQTPNGATYKSADSQRTQLGVKNHVQELAQSFTRDRHDSGAKCSPILGWRCVLSESESIQFSGHAIGIN